MPQFKLSSVKELFPDKAKKLEDQDKEVNYGRMFRLSSEVKTKIVKYVDAIVEEAKKQREGLMEIRAEGIRNYEGTEQMTGPWTGSSNISTMVTTITCDMMHSKLYPMVWNPDLIYWQGVEKHDEEVAENNGILMKWALTKDMEDTSDKVDEQIHRLVVDGTLIVKRRWEVYWTYITRVIPESVDGKGQLNYEVKYEKIRRERCVWDMKDLDYVYVQYNAENEQKAEYVVFEEYYTLPQLREMKARGLLLADIDMDEVKTSVEKTFDPKGTRKARYTAAGIEAYHARLESYPVKCYEAWLKYDINKDDIREECVFMTLPDQGLYIAGKPLHCVSRIGKRPIHIRSFLKRPGVIYGKSLPELVRHLHKEMNAIHNQRLNAGNMVIAPFFFYRSASGMDPRKIEIKPAMGIPLDDVKNDVYFPNYNAGNLQVSFQEENILMSYIEKLTYLTPAMMGKETASRPTARGTLAVIAQGEQKFGLLAARVQRIIAAIIKGTRQDYQENMPPGLEQRILGKKGKQIWGRLSPEMIAGDYDCVMELDLEAGNLAFSKQADQLIFTSLVNDPYINQNPSFAWELRAMYLTSLGKKNVEKLIGPKPDMEINAGDFEDENMQMLQEQEVKVSEQDDHVAHMNAHSQFKRENQQNLTINALKILTEHILEHRFAYTNGLQKQAMIGGGYAGEDGGQAGDAGALNAPRMGTIQGPRVQGSEASAGQ